MKQLWAQHAKQFEALKLRERLLIMLTVITTIVVAGYVGIIEPQVNRQRVAERRLVQQQKELQNLQQKVVITQSSFRDQNATARASLDKAREQLKEVSGKLRTIEQALVPPDKVAGLLENMLRHNSRVQMVTLRTLPATDLFVPKDPSAAERADRTIAQASSVVNREVTVQQKGAAEFGIAGIEGPLFKHGVEITVVGGYADLMAYLSELESMPQKVLWNSVTLSVEEYPRAQMTLTVYTISLDKTWLTV